MTGDVQMSKEQFMLTQLIVCTPEKYDIITRKGIYFCFVRLKKLAHQEASAVTPSWSVWSSSTRSTCSMMTEVRCWRRWWRAPFARLLKKSFFSKNFHYFCRLSRLETIVGWSGCPPRCPTTVTWAASCASRPTIFFSSTTHTARCRWSRNTLG